MAWLSGNRPIRTQGRCHGDAFWLTTIPNDRTVAAPPDAIEGKNTSCFVVFFWPFRFQIHFQKLRKKIITSWKVSVRAFDKSRSPMKWSWAPSTSVERASDYGIINYAGQRLSKGERWRGVVLKENAHGSDKKHTPAFLKPGTASHELRRGGFVLHRRTI